jgi:hypothetical protein
LAPPGSAVLSHTPAASTAAAATSATAATASAARQLQTSAATTTAAPSVPATARGSHGRGGGIQVRSPVTVTGRPPTSSGTCQASMRWALRGSAWTAGGSSLPIQWVRWSCQRADGPRPLRSQRGGASESAVGGMVTAARRLC